MMRIAILLTVFNRRETTLACLRAAYLAIDRAKTESQHEFSVYLTDDGCTDGTPEAVQAEFPDIHIINGDGNLFWNRGMIAAWKAAAVSDYDAYIWLNDDTIIAPESLTLILENSVYLKDKAIIVGTAEDGEGRLTYGGRRISGEIIAPDPIIPVSCDLFNGNLVFVPRYIYRLLGTMDPVYTHSFGDYDYGVRAMKAGLTSVVSPQVLAHCRRNAGVPKWRNASCPLGERYRALMSPTGRPFKEQFIYDCRKSNPLSALLHFISLNLKVLFPKRIR